MQYSSCEISELELQFSYVTYIMGCNGHFPDLMGCLSSAVQHILPLFIFLFVHIIYDINKLFSS